MGNNQSKLGPLPIKPPKNIKAFWDEKLICQRCGLKCKNYQQKVTHNCPRLSRLVSPKTTIEILREHGNTIIQGGKYNNKTFREFAADGDYIHFLTQKNARPDLLIQLIKVKSLLKQLQEETENKEEEITLFDVMF